MVVRWFWELVSSEDPSTRQDIPLVGLTSYQALALAGAPWPEGSNKTVVITSGAGGTGFLAVQMARAFAAGRIVTAAASVLPSSTPSRLPDP